MKFVIGGSLSAPDQIDFGAKREDPGAKHDHFLAARRILAELARDLVGLVERGGDLGQPARSPDRTANEGEAVIVHTVTVTERSFVAANFFGPLWRRYGMTIALFRA